MAEDIKSKKDFWQLVRGVCILAVIMIHCPTGLGFSQIDTYTWLILRQFINFPVALFVFMAGYFVNVEKIRKDVQTYVLKRGGAIATSIFDVEQSLFN